MELRDAILAFSLSLVLSSAGFGDAKSGGRVFPLTYEGGTLPLKQNHGVRAVLAGHQLMFVQHGSQFVAPVSKIRGISYATDVHRRFGAAVLGLVPVADLDRVEECYVGVSWTDDSGKRMEALFRVKPGDCRALVAALEALTGKPAVDTRKTPTVVRYEL